MRPGRRYCRGGRCRDRRRHRPDGRARGGGGYRSRRGPRRATPPPLDARAMRLGGGRRGGHGHGANRLGGGRHGRRRREPAHDPLRLDRGHLGGRVRLRGRLGLGGRLGRGRRRLGKGRRLRRRRQVLDRRRRKRLRHRRRRLLRHRRGRRQRRPRRQERERVHVTVRLARPAHAEVDVGLERHRVAARAGQGDDRSLRHRLAARDEHLAELEQRHRPAVAGLDRQRPAAAGHRPRERDRPARRRAHRGARLRPDVDPAVEPAEVRVGAEHERPEHGAVDGPRPGGRAGDEHERDGAERRKGPAHDDLPRRCHGRKRSGHGSATTRRCQL